MKDKKGYKNYKPSKKEEKTVEPLRHFEKKYENVFHDAKAQQKFKLEKVSFVSPDLNMKKYLEYYNILMDSASDYWWEFAIKMKWLSDHFKYDNFERFRTGANSHISDMTFSFFLREYGKKEYRLFTRSDVYYKLSTYFYDFFPVSEFKNNNPFEDMSFYKYPYKNISISFMFSVYQMPERLEMLEYLDKQNLPYNEFLDYLINYVNCINEELGKTKYQFIISPYCPPYVKAYNAVIAGKKKWLYEEK